MTEETKKPLDPLGVLIGGQAMAQNDVISVTIGLLCNALIKSGALTEDAVKNEVLAPLRELSQSEQDAAQELSKKEDDPDVSDVRIMSRPALLKGVVAQIEGVLSDRSS